MLQIDGNCELKWCVCSISADTKQEKYLAAHNVEVNRPTYAWGVRLKQENVNDSFLTWLKIPTQSLWTKCHWAVVNLILSLSAVELSALLSPSKIDCNKYASSTHLQQVSTLAAAPELKEPRNPFSLMKSNKQVRRQTRSFNFHCCEIFGDYHNRGTT